VTVVPELNEVEIEPLRLRPFAIFFGARVATTLAMQMVAVAVGWQIYDLTHSALALGFVGLAAFLPMVVLVLAVGVVLDRYNRRRVATLCQSIEGCTVAILFATTLGGAIAPSLIYLAVIVLGGARSFEFPALQSIFPNLVPQGTIPRASARWTSANQVATIVGPALGGVLYAFHPAVVYGTATVLYALAALLVALVRMDRPPLKREPVTIQTLFAGIGFIRRTPDVLGAISLDLFAVLLGGASALLPIYARDILHVGPWGLGLLRSAPAVGAFAMSMWLGGKMIKRRAGFVMFTAVAGFGVATVVFGLSRSFALTYAALVAIGLADVISVVIRASIVAVRTPDEMRGRVGAVNSLFIGTSNQLGEFESGVTAAWFGPVPAAVLGGVGSILVALIGWRLLPSLARIDKID
jgi:MFS family permease